MDIKISARQQVSKAIKMGKLKRKPCIVCGQTKRVHAHHYNYVEPLNITWLCGTCHLYAHGRILYHGLNKPKIDIDAEIYWDENYPVFIW